MRKILFRAKRKADRKWIYGLPVCGIFTKEQTITHIDTETQEYDSPYEIIPETLCQYIGREDKNGKPIFEGDVVRTQYGRTCSVVWFNSSVFIGWDLYALEDKHQCPDDRVWDSRYLEVIGNIFDGWETDSESKYGD
jgi:uncharacterized phage protein (TIGR01671 family)